MTKATKQDSTTSATPGKKNLRSVSARLAEDEHKKFRIFLIENGTTAEDFIKSLILQAMEKRVKKAE